MTDPGRPFDDREAEVNGAVNFTQRDARQVRNDSVAAATPADLSHDHPSDRHDQADDHHGGEPVLEYGAGGVGVHGTTVPTATLGPGDFPASSIGSPAP